MHTSTLRPRHVFPRDAEAVLALVERSRRRMDGSDVQVKFDVPAVVRKWPSLNNARRIDGAGPYLVFEGSLDECLREFMARPESVRHLYEIQTAPQAPLITDTLSAEHVVELARLREFL